MGRKLCSFLCISVILPLVLSRDLESGFPYADATNRLLCPPNKDEPQPPNRVNSTDALKNLRKLMVNWLALQAPLIDAYIVTTHNAHQSEFVPEYDRRLKHLSGFSGSEGLAIVTNTKAALWVNGLYHTQADQELSCEWLLMRHGNPNVPTPEDWLIDELRPKTVIGADPHLIPNALWESWERKLYNASIELKAIPNNLIDQFWTKTAFPSYEAYNVPLNYTGATWQTKVGRVRREMEKLGCDVMIVTAIEEIAWLLNIRGYDNEFSPYLRAYVILTKDKIHLFADEQSLTPAVHRNLHTSHCVNAFCVRVKPYESIFEHIRTDSQAWTRVLLPSESVFSPGASRAIVSAVRSDKRLLAVSPIIAMKAEKNEVERAGMKRAHVRDAAAICDFMAFVTRTMQQDLDTDHETWDELKMVRELNRFRREENLTRGISFPTIVAFGPHSAIPHYVPSNLTNVQVDKSNMLLIDSGGHYYDGTTDVTRTFHLGTPTEEQITAYTRVLMGLIDLSAAPFPKDSSPQSLDSIARAPIWEMAADYPHGTGHGIGTFNSIHESPLLISGHITEKFMFKEGHFVSIEPGYYRDGKFGVRLENIVEIVKSNISEAFLAFHTVTLVPFEQKLIDVNKLDCKQKVWLNHYNHRIRHEVGGLLNEQMRRGYEWLLVNTRHIPINSCETISTHSMANLSRPSVCLVATLILCLFYYLNSYSN
ncbi:unnamed protein product [Bemisia tabaci]|uniref:Xaa-Pro aminopeptidase 1 n=1 Tax=Bemisia tabaci TaxID=7038 RepID=A0A9P0A9U9_BEMTA|nr:unnamed protein product [Bemisia tabaci]